jgi:lipoprotein-releasing system permease protein
MLARRYLNPRRSMLSSFSLISLIGVMLGVLVLVVVMAVYAGMERDVKKRYLGFTPHILLRERVGEVQMAVMEDWREVAEKAKGLPRVEAAVPFVAGPVVVVGEHFKNCQIAVGDRLRLISGSNVEEVIDAYEDSDRPLLREAHKEAWDKATAALAAAWQQDGDKWLLPLKSLEDEVYNPLFALRGEPIRQAEGQLLDNLLVSMEKKEFDEAKGEVRFTAAEKAAVEEAVAALGATDVEKMDAEIFKGLKSIVLPREVTVVGVYQATMMVITPDVFMPLPLAQGLAGTEDRAQGVALRLDDAYAAEQVAAAGRQVLGRELAFVTWGEQFKAFFSVISQQRVMLYFVLSFIALISAFSMMAVMFTVTIQKRREIGVMKALGAAPGQIVRVFLYQGMLLGVLGAGLGVGLGRVVIHFRGELQAVMRALGFDPFSMVTGSPLLPAYNNPVEQAVIAFAGFVLCSVAAFVPAFIAARSDAAKSLRNL